jgi:hypothetical protein
MCVTKENLMKMFGYSYLLNLNTGEVHDLKNPKPSCGVDKMSKKNKKYLTISDYLKIEDTIINHHKVNGCRFCLAENDTDMLSV